MRTFAYTSPARLVAALVLVGCSSGLGPFSRPVLTTDASTYAAGATISATVVNRTEVDIGFGTCPFSLERRVADQWTSVPRPNYDCDASMLVLGAGREATLQFFLEPALQPGTYRLLMGYSPRTTRPGVVVRSPSFVVRSSD